MLFCLLGLLVQCKSSMQSTTAKENVTSSPETAVQNLTLDLVDTMNPKRIIASFPKYNLNLVCTLNERSNVHLFSFDNRKYTVQELVDFLGKEVGVESAFPGGICRR